MTFNHLQVLYFALNLRYSLLGLKAISQPQDFYFLGGEYLNIVKL